MATPTVQTEAAAFLQRLTGAPPVETPISAVFVGRFTAWKLKKAVAKSFLDFTALDERRRLLLRELELNRPNAPAIYRDVAAIVRTPHGTLAITPEPGGRRVLDWVLRMAPVRPECFCDHPEALATLGPPRLDALADMVAAMHGRAAPAEIADPLGTMLSVAEANAVAARDAGVPVALVEEWLPRVRGALEALADWLAGRARSGFVRRCHGDLHLGNVLLREGQPLAFDALEFDEALGTIDVAYDLAFLLMDLDLRLSRAAANQVLNRYVARTGDGGIAAGLAPFGSLRAMIRGHVLAAGGKPADDYLGAAIAYLRPPTARKLVIAVGGLPGTGKSTLARRVAPGAGGFPGALVLRSDEIRKRQHGVAPEQRLPEAAYTEAANRAVMEAILEGIGAAATPGQPVIADATFLDPEHRTALSAAARRAGADFLGVWLDAPMRVLAERVSARRGDASDATVEVLRQAAQAHLPPSDWMWLDGRDLDGAAQAIASRL